MLGSASLLSGRVQCSARPSSALPCIQARTGQAKRLKVFVKIPQAQQTDSQGEPVVAPKRALQDELMMLQSSLHGSMMPSEGDSRMYRINKALLSSWYAQCKSQLVNKHATSTQPACGPADVWAAECAARDATTAAAYHIHAALNGSNTCAGLEWLGLPFSLAVPLLEATYTQGLIQVDGSPVLRAQPRQPFVADLAAYLQLSCQLPMFVGRYEDIFGNDDMVVVPAAFPWLEDCELAKMLTDSVIDNYIASLPAGQRLIATAHQLGLGSSSVGAKYVYSMRSLTMWSGLLVRKFAEVFVQQHIRSAQSVVAAAASAAQGVEGVDAALLTSSSGGSSGSGVFTAVGGGDEGELECGVNLQLPLCKLSEEDTSSNQQHCSSTGTCCSQGGVCAGKTSKGWWARVADAAAKLVNLLSSS